MNLRIAPDNNYMISLNLLRQSREENIDFLLGSYQRSHGRIVAAYGYFRPMSTNNAQERPERSHRHAASYRVGSLELLINQVCRYIDLHQKTPLSLQEIAETIIKEQLDQIKNSMSCLESKLSRCHQLESSDSESIEFIPISDNNEAPSNNPMITHFKEKLKLFKEQFSFLKDDALNGFMDHVNSLVSTKVVTPHMTPRR